MAIPSLKRVTVSSEGELENWLARDDGAVSSVMLVTHAHAAHRKHVSRESVRKALAAHGWAAGRRYTLNADLLGHVITRPGG